MLRTPSKLLSLRCICGILKNKRILSTNENNTDPAPLFFNPKIQDILWKLTDVNNPEKVFRRRPGPIKNPQYQFMTDEQLQQAKKDALEKAKGKLQMPPVLKAAEPAEIVLSDDKELKGLDKSKLLFVDISQNVPERKRLVVVRDLDGKLRKANWEEWSRAIRMFFPIPHRTVQKPKMFEQNELKNLKDRGEYEFILDRACLQFEPDDPNFIQICHGVYNHIDEQSKYDVLKSTRHFGPMIFYLACKKRLDNAINEEIRQSRIQSAADMVRLHRMLHGALDENPQDDKPQVDNLQYDMDIIKSYVEKDSTQKTTLEHSLKTWQHLQSQRNQYEAQLMQVHGKV